MEAEEHQAAWSAADIAHPTHFGKVERLCGEKTISSLFGGGKSFVRYPLRLVYRFSEQSDARAMVRREAVCRMMVSVSKRIFKRAVKRNRVKRQIREAWRKEKGPLAVDVNEAGMVLDVAFIFVGKELPSSVRIGKAMSEAVGSLRQAVARGVRTPDGTSSGEERGGAQADKQA